MPSQITEARIILFKNLAEVAAITGKMECIKGFKDSYPDLLERIAKEQPLYFKTAAIAEVAISDETLRQAVVTKIKESLAGSGETEHQNPSYWNEYSQEGIERMLKLRLGLISDDDLGANVESLFLDAGRFFDESTSSIIAREIVSKAASQLQNGTKKLLIPLNLYGKHWVGMTVESEGNSGKVIVTYMDSERNPMPKLLYDGLKVELARSYPNPHSAIEITEKAVEPQNSNNCGLQVIENLIAAIAGEDSRIEQEKVLAAHSVLYEQKVIEEALQEEVRQKALDEQLVEQGAAQLGGIAKAEELRFKSQEAATNDNDYAVEERAWQASAPVVTKSTEEADTLEQPAGSRLPSNQPNIPAQQPNVHQDSIAQAKYEAEITMREMRETREKSAEALTPTPLNEPRYGGIISPREVGASVESLFGQLVGSPNWKVLATSYNRPDNNNEPANSVPVSTLELAHGVRSNPTDRLGASRASQRSKDDLIKDMEKEHSGTGVIGSAFPPSSLSFDVPNSQPWSEEFEMTVLVGESHVVK